MSIAAIGRPAVAGPPAPAPPGPAQDVVPATASPAPPPAPGRGPQTLALSEDGLERLTIPVVVDGQGPFPFVIDTGADRTVISSELAQRLRLPAGPRVSVQNSGGADDVDTVIISALGVGTRTTGRIEAPVLSQENLGAAGMLGIDSLRDQHVVMDFQTRRMQSVASAPEIYDPATIVVRGRSRFGQLVLVDAMVRGVSVYVILDSGAQNTVGNLELKRLLGLRATAPEAPKVTVISVTGRQTPAEFKEIAEMRIGGLTIRNMRLAFADLYTFHRFGLVDRPAMLLGMDVLKLCERVTVDFKRREATFTVY